MIPQNIANQLLQLKNNTKSFGQIQRTLTTYEKRDKTEEIKTEVNNLNEQLIEHFAKIDSILIDAWNSEFDTANWFDSKMDTAIFTEPNPRLVYEKKVQEDQLKEKEVRINTFKNICKWGPENKSLIISLISRGFNIEKDGNIYDVDALLKMGRSFEFIEFLIEEGMKFVESDLQKLAHQKTVFYERIKREQEEADRKKQEELEQQKKEQEIADKKKQEELEQHKKELLDRLEKLRLKRAEERQKLQEQKEEEQRRIYHQNKAAFNDICKNGPDDINKIKELINNGFDIQKDGRVYDIPTLIRMGRSIQFIEVLIQAGMKADENDIIELETQRAIIDDRIKKEQEETDRKKQDEIERKQKELIQKQEIERIEEFKRMCQHWDENTNDLKKLIKNGLDIQNIQGFDFIDYCIKSGKNKEFIRIVVEAGALVKVNHLRHFYDEYDKELQRISGTKLFVSSVWLTQINEKIKLLENAKNIEDKAILISSKRKRSEKLNVIILLSVIAIVIIIAVIFSII